MIRIKYGIVLICIIIFTSSCNKDVNEKKTEESRDEAETTEEMRETYVIKSNNEIFTNTFYAGVNKIEADMYLRGKRLELTEKEEILKVCACFSELEFIEKITECQTDRQRDQIQTHLFFTLYNALRDKPPKKCRNGKIKCGLQGFIL